MDSFEFWVLSACGVWRTPLRRASRNIAGTNFLLRFQRFLVFKVPEDPRPFTAGFLLESLWPKNAEGAIGL